MTGIPIDKEIFEAVLSEIQKLKPPANGTTSQN